MKRLLIGIVHWYQRCISPLKPPCCRFYPTCSHYALEAIQKYGPLKGGLLSLKRISRCHPFHRKDYDIYDPVP